MQVRPYYLAYYNWGWVSYPFSFNRPFIFLSFGARYFSYQCTYVFPWAKQTRLKNWPLLPVLKLDTFLKSMVTEFSHYRQCSPMMSRPVWPTRPSQLYNDLPGCLYAMKSIIAPYKIEITLNHRRNTALNDFIIVVQPGSDRLIESNTAAKWKI